MVVLDENLGSLKFTNDCRNRNLPNSCFTLNHECQLHGGKGGGTFRGLPKSLGLILWGPWIAVPNSMAIHLTVVKTNVMSPNPQKSATWWHQRKVRGLSKAFSDAHEFMTIHPIVVEIYQFGPKWSTSQSSHTTREG